MSTRHIKQLERETGFSQAEISAFVQGYLEEKAKIREDWFNRRETVFREIRDKFWEIITEVRRKRDLFSHQKYREVLKFIEERTQNFLVPLFGWPLEEHAAIFNNKEASEGFMKLLEKGLKNELYIDDISIGAFKGVGFGNLSQLLYFLEPSRFPIFSIPVSRGLCLLLKRDEGNKTDELKAIKKIVEINEALSDKLWQNDLADISGFLTWFDDKFRKLEKPKTRRYQLDGEKVQQFLETKGLREKKDGDLLFPESEVESFITALLTKPFVILSGVSGTGKTQLARAVAQKWVANKGTPTEAKDLFGDPSGEYYTISSTEVAIEVKSERYAFMPVRPDWNEAKKVFGFYNPLTGLFYPSDALKVVLNAYREYVKNPNNPQRYFIILDEMNLARVEYYFSDILSAMENPCSVENNTLKLGEPFPVHFLPRCVLSKKPEGKQKKDEWLCEENCKYCPYRPLLEGKKDVSKEEIKDIPENAKEAIPPRIPIPPNLTIIGTVNVDETTFSFAPKVLDRAFVLEFKEVGYEAYLNHVAKGKYDFLQDNGKINDFDFCNSFLEKMKSILQPANLHFGYRVVKEMLDFLDKAKISEKLHSHLDFLIKSKVLPKVRGTDEQIGLILKELFVFCSNKTEDHGKLSDDSFKENLAKQTLKDLKKAYSGFRFPASAAKVEEMLRNVEATGFASYF